MSIGRRPPAAIRRWRRCLPSSAREGAAMKLIEDANKQALARIVEGEPKLIDIVPAREVLTGLKERMILHAGPPIDWERMCGPMRGAVAGAIVFEGWAPDLKAADRACGKRRHRLSPQSSFRRGRSDDRHDHGVDAAVRRREHKVRQSRLLRDQRGPRQGDALRRQRRERAGAPRLAARRVRPGARQGDPRPRRHRSQGDHRARTCRWATRCISAISPAPACSCARSGRRWRAPRPTTSVLADCIAFIAQNDQFFLNIAMAMGKAMTDPASGIRGSTVVTAMSRNGTDFGIRVSGLGDRWFTAPVEMPEGLYFPGYSRKDANPDMGDSAIVETVGLGGFAMAAAPAVAGFIGAGSPSMAGNFTRAMGEITVGQNPEWTIPALDFRRRADRHRCAAGGGDRACACHQHRHRASRARHRPGRRRRGAGADGLLPAGGRRDCRRSGGVMSAYLLNEVRKGFYLELGGA